MCLYRIPVGEPPWPWQVATLRRAGQLLRRTQMREMTKRNGRALQSWSYKTEAKQTICGSILAWIQSHSSLKYMFSWPVKPCIPGLFRLYSRTSTCKDLVIRPHPTRNETTTLESWNESPGGERDGCGARPSHGIGTRSCIPANWKTRDGQ